MFPWSAIAEYHTQLTNSHPLVASWAEEWPRLAQARVQPEFHGDFPKWFAAMETALQAFQKEDWNSVEEQLQNLHPWRKGPFHVGPIHVDSEWRSDLKFDRIAEHLTLTGQQHVLDIGCGNGYYGWRLLESGAASVTGIDPTSLFVCQHWLIHGIAQIQSGFAHNFVLPLGIEDLPKQLDFDLVLSMGVLGHRRDPAQHLRQLFNSCRSGGQTIVETLVLESAAEEELIPEGRYAQMRNIWHIPSVPLLVRWCQEAGFENVQCVDCSRTSSEEQRKTEWMRFHSLEDFLDPEDPSLTIEGHPGPVRAVLTMNRP